MKVMDAIKKGFEIASKNLNLVLIVFIFNVVWNLAVIPFSPEAAAGVTMTPALTILSIIFILASIFVQGGILGSVKDIVKEGKQELGRFVNYGAKFYLRLLCIALIIILIIGVVGFIATLIVATSAPTGNAGLIAFTAIIALVIAGLGLYLMLLLFLSPYILIAEDTGVLKAMRMSIDFVRKIVLKVLGLGALLVLIGLGIGLLMGVVAGILSIIFKGKILQFIMGIISGGVNGYISIVVTSCLMTYYLTMKGAQSKESPAV